VIFLVNHIFKGFPPPGRDSVLMAVLHQKVGLYFSLLPNQNVTTETLTPFL